MKKNPQLGYTSSARRHPLPRVKKAWIPLHNSQVRLCAECLQVVKSAPNFSPKWETLSFSPSSAKRKCYFKHTLIHLFQFKFNKKRGAKRAARWLLRLLRLSSYSKWESLNRAPMNITTSLDLKSPGIFVGIACALQEETPPRRPHCCFTRGTARSMCPHALSLPSYIMLLCVFFCDSFERDSWNDHECSCVNSYLKFRFELTGYYNTIRM